MIRPAAIFLAFGAALALASDKDGFAPPSPPLPPSGANEQFTYERAPDIPGSYIVRPLDEPGTWFVVTEDFLSLVARRTNLTEAEKLDTLAGFPAIAESVFASIFTMHYPASGAPEDQPFASARIEDSAGNRALLEQDTLAPPYVRVELTPATGLPSYFSVSRRLADDVATNMTLTPERRIELLASFPFRLPETARGNFSLLSQSQLWALAMSQPALTNQSIVQVKRTYDAIGDKMPMPKRGSRSAGEATATPSALVDGAGPGRIAVSPAAPSAARATAETSSRSESRPAAALRPRLGTAALLVLCGAAIGALLARVFAPRR